jgi:GntR family transcriptional regulator
MLQDNLQFSINMQSPIAVYVQIENQVQFAVASGILSPGDTLPSVRELSSMLNVNPNTVTKAYRDLELMQLVQTRRGVGVTIAPEAPDRCSDTIRATALAHLQDAVAECLASGISAAEVRAKAASTIDSKVRPYENNHRKG